MQRMIENLKEAISEGGVIAFTGAGVSAESGIPTYRGKDGFWTKYDPSKYASIEYFNLDPSYYWSFFKDTRAPLIHDARPNPGHVALAEMEKAGYLDAVITQNIDGLHQAGGSKQVIELHGSTRRFYCVDCNKKYSLQEAEGALDVNLPPRCNKCEGIIRPDVVFFGEMLPPGLLEKAFTLAKSASVIITVGSTLIVYPASHVPAVAKQAGARLAIVNDEPTPLDDIADWTLYGNAGEILPQLI